MHVNQGSKVLLREIKYCFIIIIKQISGAEKRPLITKCDITLHFIPLA